VPRVETTSRMDSPTASVVSKAISYFMPGGKRLPAVEFGDALLVNVERVGGGKLSDAIPTLRAVVIESLV